MGGGGGYLLNGNIVNDPGCGGGLISFSFSFDSLDGRVGMYAPSNNRGQILLQLVRTP